MVYSDNLASRLRCELARLSISIDLLAVYLAQGLVVLVVSYVITRAVPADIILVSFFLRIEQGHHTVVELRVTFDEVDYVERVFTITTRVVYFEVKPLREVFGAVVRLQDKLVLILVNLNRLSEITRFKTRFEEEHIIYYWWLAAIICAFCLCCRFCCRTGDLAIFYITGLTIIQLVPWIKCLKVTILCL